MDSGSLKILNVIPYFPPAWPFGGPASVVSGLSKELAARGHEVVVWTSDCGKKMNSNTGLRENGIRIEYHHSISPKTLRKIKFFVTPATLRQALGRRNLDFDVMHLHEYRTFQNVVLSFSARIFSIPYLVQAHGAIPKSIGPGALKLAYDELVGSRILRNASRVVALSQAEAGQYKQMSVPDSKIAIIPNGIDLSEFNALPRRGLFREKHGLGEQERVVLYLGRIHEIKGLDLLVSAFARVIPKIPDSRLVIIGPDDGYLSTLMSIILNSAELAKKTLVLPPLQDMEKLEALVDADVYVLPSKYDAFPMSVLEAIACGAPTIVTEGCGLANDCRGKVGLVSRANGTELGEALVKVMVDEDLRSKFRRNSSGWIKDYDVKRTVSRLEEVYEEIIGR